MLILSLLIYLERMIAFYLMTFLLWVTYHSSIWELSLRLTQERIENRLYILQFEW